MNFLKEPHLNKSFKLQQDRLDVQSGGENQGIEIPEQAERKEEKDNSQT
jgi:hypothetical protein